MQALNAAAAVVVSGITSPCCGAPRRHACELGFVGKGDVVAIWGAGPVGALAAHCAQVRGCKGPGDGGCRRRPCCVHKPATPPVRTGVQWVELLPLSMLSLVSDSHLVVQCGASVRKAIQRGKCWGGGSRWYPLSYAGMCATEPRMNAHPLQVRGAARVILIDKVVERLEFAKAKLPGLEVIDSSKVPHRLGGTHMRSCLPLPEQARQTLLWKLRKA